MVNNKTGCLMWAILFCFVLLWGYKLLDFYVLQPAMVKKELNEAVESIGRVQTTAARQVEFNTIWAEYERTSEIEFVFTGFQGDSFIVQWEDTLHVPVFPSISHEFRQKRLVR